MKYSFFPFAAVILLIAASCSREPQAENITYSDSVSVQTDKDYYPGLLRVKFKKEVTDTKAAGIDLSMLGNYQITRTFPPAGKWEERHRRYGLHLWYDIRFDSGLPLTKAGSEVSELPDVDIVEYVPVIKPAEEEIIYPFNDPGLPEQWHYHNPGGKAQWAEGCDVNAFKAWTLETGKPEVIVAVNDVGVDYSHEDLAANMWVNQAEFNGKPGEDDDHNGYVDDIYGYSFISYDGSTLVGKIEPGDHGTHVAGTIAAVNNNGIGVCGVAGGDGTPGSGVRIMCTQMMDGRSNGNVPASFVYAADNGAVIINCSWSQNYEPDASEMAAFDYFNECAGMGPDGEQTGPMAGGLICFAAGNAGVDYGYPAMCENVFAVAALSANYVRSYYSSYGPWVDISAPGGDALRKTYVYSTLPNNTYGNSQGSSMACPHAAGVAALIVSHYGAGRKGFTRDKLIYLIQSTANKKALEENGSFADRLGAGLIDAYAAITVPISEKGPAQLKEFTLSSKSNFVTAELKIPAAETGEEPYAYNFYYSEKALDNLNPANPGDGVSVLRVIDAGKAAGEIVSGTTPGLKFDTEYHFRVCSENLMNVFSPLSEDQVVKTGSNSKPVVEPLDGTEFQIPAHAVQSMRFAVSDPDGHQLSVGMSVMYNGMQYVIENNLVIVTISAQTAEQGRTYDAVLEVSDGFDTTLQPFRYTILKNRAPEVKETIPDQIYTSTSEVRTFKLSDYFSDPDGETLKYSVETTTTSIIVDASIDKDILTVKGHSYGLTGIVVTASDANHATAELEFRVLVRNADSGFDIYPNPFKDYLNLRSGDYGTVDVSISNRAGALVFEQKGVEVSPFDPAKLDLRSLPGGVYYARIGEHSFTVVKQ